MSGRGRGRTAALALAFGFVATQEGLAAFAVPAAAQEAVPSIDPRVAVALERFDRGDAKGALAELERLRTAAADDATVQLTIAHQLELRQQYAAAEPFARRALALRPEFGPAHLMLGISLIATDRAEEAEQLLRAALARFSGTEDEAELVFNLAMACALRNKRLDASEAFARAVALRPGNALFHFSAAENDLNLKRLDAAEAGFRRAMALDPPHPDAGWKLAVTLAAADRPDEAEPLFAQAVASASSASRPGAAYHYAHFLFERGRPKEALPLLESTVKARPNDRMAWHYLARTLRALGRPEDAAKALARYRQIQAAEDRQETEYLLAILRQQLEGRGATGSGDRKPLPDRR